MILAGDVGGTSTRLAIFEARGGRLERLRLEVIPSAEVSGLSEAIGRFRRPSDPPVRAAAFGIAGPVAGERVKTTNLPWEIDARSLAAELGIERVRLLNDLEAMAWAIETLGPSELATLQEGAADPAGNGAVIAAGTGLGQALLFRREGRLLPSATEGGHGDLASGDEETDGLIRWLRGRFGRVSAERVISGPGIELLYRYHHDSAQGGPEPHLPEDGDIPARLPASGAPGGCPACARALDHFLRCYGAEAGNLALRSAATGGLWVGGGIAAKNLAAMRSGAFMRAFLDKGRFEDWMRRIPVRVILDQESPLRGAALVAARAAGLLPG